MRYLFLSLSTLLTITMMSGCLRDECTTERTFVRYEPIFKPLSEIRTDIKAESPRDLKAPGKIYALGNYLFINEKQEGIHVIDNTDPANPQKITFWSIPGNCRRCSPLVKKIRSKKCSRGNKCDKPGLYQLLFK